jgi:hypothetical protein
MPSAVKMRTDLTPAELRRLAASSKHANQSRRLLSLAVEGRSREKARRIGGMHRQTVREAGARAAADPRSAHGPFPDRGDGARSS